MTKPEKTAATQYVVEKAGPDDLPLILEVMKPWNMHHYPSPEMEELDVNNFFVAKIGGGNCRRCRIYPFISKTGKDNPHGRAS